MSSLEAVDGHGIGVIQLGHEAGFAAEPLPSLLILSDLWLDQLERALTIELEVIHEPDLAHSPLADLLDQPELAENLPSFREHRRRQYVPLLRPFHPRFWGSVLEIIADLAVVGRPWCGR